MPSLPEKEIWYDVANDHPSATVRRIAFAK
jgi:hypothetical protein